MGGKVFLKLQPYVQATVAHRANHKLSFRFFGPFPVTEKIGEVAYRLQLPVDSKVHPVFHVSQLKKFVPPKYQVLDVIPSHEAHLQVPVRVLQQRLKTVGTKTIAQVLIERSGTPSPPPTWEDRDALKQMFPRAEAWGQASSQEWGNVSGLTDSQKEQASSDRNSQERDGDDSTHGPTGRPISTHKKPHWLASPNWAR